MELSKKQIIVIGLAVIVLLIMFGFGGGGGSLPLIGSVSPLTTTATVGMPVTIKATPVGGTAPYSFSWRINQITQQATGQTFSFSSNSEGTYVVDCTITDAAGASITTQPSTITVIALVTIEKSKNVMLIYDQPWLAMNQNCLNNIPKVVNDLKNGHTEFAIIFLGYIDSLDTANPHVEYFRTAAFYQDLISQLHAVNIKAIAWIEDGGGGQVDLSPSNWQNLYNMVLGAVNIGFDGYFDDIESFKGPNGVNNYQDQIAWLNSLTPVLHNIGKLNMPAVAFDWEQHINNVLTVDYICSMFYSSRSTLEDSQCDGYWQENFGQYWGHNTPPASPIIMMLMNYYGNSHPLNWQLAQVSRLLAAYPHPNLAGLGIWLYEYMGTNVGDWDAWNSWMSGSPVVTLTQDTVD